MKKFTRQFMALLLCLCLMLSAAPSSVFATDDDMGGDASDEAGVIAAAAAEEDAESMLLEAADDVTVNAAAEYGLALTDTLSGSTTTISYTYGSSNNNAATATITVHFVDSDGNELTGAAISCNTAPSYATRNSTVALSTLAGYYTVTVDSTTYSYLSGYSKIATSSSTSYSAATTAEYFRYNRQGSSNNWRWQYSTNGSSYTSLSSGVAITDIYLVYGDSSNITWSKNDTNINKGTADHIDIEVDTTATIVIDGVTYTASITLTKSDFKNNVTVIARWNGQTFSDFTVDDSNITTSSSSANAAQYRVGGSYPVGTIDNPVEYQFTLRKTVTFSDGNGNTFDVTMDFVSEWFSYWQTTNACPALSNSQTSWKSGSFISGSGLDFALSASAEAVTILVNKYIVDESGNLLAVDEDVAYEFDVYEDLNEDMVIDTASGDGVVNKDTFAVAAGSSSDSYSTQVDPGYYCVIEDTDSLTGNHITVGGKEYTYSRTYTTSSGVLESTGTTGTKETTNGTTGVLKADASTTAVFNIYNVYKDTSTTSVTVTKEWDDSNNVYGLRPASVSVQLYQGSAPYGEAATLTEAGSWTYTWNDLPAPDGTNDYAYTVLETAVTGYTSATTGNAADGYTITNTLDTGSLTLTKTVKADSSIAAADMTFTFYVGGFGGGVTSVTDSEGTTYPVTGGVAAVAVPANGSVTLQGIPAGNYTVYETDGTTVTANGYTWTVSGDNGTQVTVTKDGTASAAITNTVTGTTMLYITKNWVDAGNSWSTRPANDGTSFSVTLTATGADGEKYTYSTTAAWTESTNTWTIDLTGVKVYDTEGNKLTYSITETAPDGYTLDKVTVSGYGDGVISKAYPAGSVQNASVTPADGEVNVALQNSLDTASVTVTKTLKDSGGQEITDAADNDDDFTMQLYTYDAQTGYTEVAAHTLTLSDVMTYTFSDLPVGTYYLKEVLAGTNDHAYTVTVTIDGTEAAANEDGYYVIDLTTAGAAVEVSVTNQEQEIDIKGDTKTFPAVTKTYTSNSTSSSAETTFSFYIMDAGGSTVATGTAATSVGADSAASVTWNYTEGAFTYTEVGTYVYTIREYNSGAAGIKYDDTVYTMVVTVYTDNDGKLASDYEIYTAYYGEDAEGNESVDDKTAAFTNTYSPSEINFFMIVRKELTGRTIKEGEFSVTLQEYEYSDNTKTYTTKGEAITVNNGADSTFSHTFTYSDEGTYYYKAYENKESETGMTYDSKTSWIKVVVGSESGVLKVTSVEWVQFDTDTAPTGDTTWTAYSGTLSDYVAFENKYEATGTAALTAYKSLSGRALTEGEFNFLLVALDSSAPMPDGYTTAAAGDAYVTGGYVVAGEHYVIAANAADGSIRFGDVTYTQDDIGKTYTYRVEEIDGTLPGVTYDTVNLGKLIYVKVEDGGNGTLNITVTTSGTEDRDSDGTGDVVIYNTFDQGTTTIYGTKVWVDGGLTHVSSSEVKLTLYCSTDGGTNWEVYKDTYTVAWGTLNTDRWHIENLPVYSTDGSVMTYKVVETAVSGYTTTYDSSDDDASDAEAVPASNSASSRYTITNTIEQEYITLNGTKTWIDGGLTHDNSEEVGLTVTRTSAGTGTVTLIEGNGKDYTVSWEGGSYTITGTGDGLPKYDAQGYEYTYTVREAAETNGQVKVTINGVEYTYDVSDDGEGNITNTRVPEEPTAGKTVDIGDEDTADDNGDTVVVDGEPITYTISYYNGSSTEAVVTITDVLDRGVTYVSATDPDSWTGNKGGSYNFTDETTGTSFSYGGTVKWEFTAAAFESGSVTLTVVVNENAKVAGDGLSSEWDDTATVDNQATVTFGENDYTTNIVTNPLTDDDPTDPEKVISTVEEPQYDESGDITAYETQTEEDGTTDNLYVSVNDLVTYNIVVANNTNTTRTYYVIDTLDEGVDYYNSGFFGTYTADGTTITVGTDTITVPAHSVYWVVDVYPFTASTLWVTVQVNENAKTAGQTYAAVDPDTGENYTDYTYDCTASIANQAAVYTVGNDAASYTNVVENPLEPEDPEDPTKTVDTGDADAADDNGDAVAVGDLLTYTIGYYNNLNEAAAVTIVDALDDGVDFISASDGGVYDADTHTVTWTIRNATPLTEGSVTLQVQVNEKAKITESGETAAVKNQADVTVGEVENSTEIVVNPINPDDPGVPEKVVSADSEAGVNGANAAAGDQITYTISYYNHNNTAAAVTIMDALDDGVDFISASNGGVYDADTHTVTWTIDSVSAFTGGTVDLTVEINSTAVTQVENDAVVTIGENDYTTNTVTTPVDDDPEDPTKTETGCGDGTVDENGDITYDEVAVGDEITYIITYYNYYGTEADITITDQMDPGVEFVSATDQDGNTLTADDVFADENDTYVKWPAFTAKAYEAGSVTLTVRVTENAKTADPDGNAAVENEAIVQIGSDSAVSTNAVTNPLKPDDPADPTKSVDVGDGAEVAAGDKLVYTISYYNNLSTTAAVVIEDRLDDGVDFVEASDDGVYDPDTHTVTWTIDAAAYESGAVTVTVKVADSAAGEKVENTASVQIGNAAAVSTNTVTNEVEEAPAEASPTPGSGSAPETGDQSILGWLIAMLAAIVLGLTCVTALTASRRKRSRR